MVLATTTWWAIKDRAMKDVTDMSIQLSTASEHGEQVESIVL